MQFNVVFFNCALAYCINLCLVNQNWICSLFGSRFGSLVWNSQFWVIFQAPRLLYLTGMSLKPCNRCCFNFNLMLGGHLYRLTKSSSVYTGGTRFLLRWCQMFKVKNERDKRNTFQDRDINILNLFKCDSVNDAVMCLVHITQALIKL